MPLDRPVWNALQTSWAPLAAGCAEALRLDPDFGPFAATDGSAAGAEALRRFITDGRELWLVEAALPPLPRDVPYTTTAMLQMVAGTPLAAGDDSGVRRLGDADANEMRALAELTAPGPFLAKTHRIGEFFGIHWRGRLVAMAGTRMRLPGFAELSGVCTHPEARGKGHAARLSRLVAVHLQGQGLVPFLHTYPGNAAAVALYTALGFEVRSEMVRATFNGAAPMHKSHPG